MRQVIKAAIMNYMRNKKTMLFNFIFPIFLVVLLGTVLSGAMQSSVTVNVDDIEVGYLDEGNEDGKEILSILKSLEDEMNFKFVEENSLEKGKENVRINKSILLHFNGDVIDFYSNDKYLVQSSVVYGTLTAITDGFNAKVEMFKVDPQLAGEILINKSTDSNNYFTSEKIAKEKTPTALGYYGIAELGLMIFYFVSTPIYHLDKERKNKIKDRINLTGISDRKYYLGSFIGYSIVCYISILTSYLVLKFIIGVDYGENIFILPLAFLPFVLLVISTGVLFSIIFKESHKADAILNSMIIPVLCFLGGGYVAFNELSGLLNILSNISPLRWFNKGILNYIYVGNSVYLNNWLLLGFIISFILIIVISILSSMEERFNG